MQFLNPGAFWALFLVAIPILIHLFNLRRIKKIYFSNLTFLRDVTQQQKSRSTLKKLLILSCRILTVVFLVLAFSRPVFLSDRQEAAAGSSIIYLDNSFSMQRTDESGNLLLLNGLNAVEGTVSGAPRENEIGLITNDKALVRLLPPDKILDELLEVDYSKNSVPLETIYEKTKRIQADELLVFSDMQRTTILPLEQLLQDTSRRFIFYQLTSPVESNLYVDTVFLDKPLVANIQSELTIGIKNTGEDEVRDVLLKIFKDGQQLSSFTVNIPALSVQNVSLELGVNTDVVGKYRIEIDDAPIVFDNTYFFAINPTERPVIVILSETSTGTYLEKVYSNEEYFQLISTSVSNTSFQDIARADLLILDQLQTIPEWLLSQLSNVAGDILVVPAEDINSESYTSILGFPVKKRNQTQATTLSPESLENPFLEGVFNRKSDRMSMPDVTIKYNLSGYFSELIKTSTNDPFLVEAGKGGVYFLATPLLDSNTNFQKHALFVPVMYKLAHNREATRLSYRLDEKTIVFRMDSLKPQTIIKLVNNSGTFIPSFRHIDDRLLLEMPQVLNSPGIYAVVAEQDTLRSLALNYHKTESEIESIAPDEFRRLISGYDHIELEEIRNVPQFLSHRSTDNQEGSLWKYALFLALFFISSELLLLRFF